MHRRPPPRTDPMSPHIIKLTLTPSELIMPPISLNKVKAVLPVCNSFSSVKWASSHVSVALCKPTANKINYRGFDNRIWFLCTFSGVRVWWLMFRCCLVFLASRRSPQNGARMSRVRSRVKHELEAHWSHLLPVYMEPYNSSVFPPRALGQRAACYQAVWLAHLWPWPFPPLEGVHLLHGKISPRIHDPV